MKTENKILKNKLVALPEFDVYTRPRLQISALESEPFSLSPVFTFQPNSEIVFEKSASSIFWTNPEIYIHAYITVKKQISGTEEWVNITPVDKFIGLSSNPLSSLISSVQFYLNDCLITEKDQLFPFIDFIKLTHLTGEDERSILEASCLGYKYPVGKIADPDSTEHQKMRTALSAKGEHLLVDKIRIPLLEQDQLLLPGCNLKIVFSQTSSEFRAISLEDKANKIQPAKILVKIEKLFLHGLHHTSNDNLYIASMKQLGKEPANYPIKRFSSSTFQFSSGATEVHHPISLATGTLPSFILIQALDTNQFYGSLSGSPYLSRIDDIEKIYCKIENMEFPRGGYNLTERNGQVICYNDYRQCVKLLTGDSSCGVTFDEFSSNYGIVAICLDRYAGSAQAHAISLSRQGFGELVIRRKTPTQDPKTYLITCIYNNNISIDQGMSVKMDY